MKRHKVSVGGPIIIKITASPEYTICKFSTSLDKPKKQVYYIYIPYGGIYMPKGIPRDNTIKHQLLHRLKITAGHLDRVIKMVESGDYCIDVIHQSQAVQSALKQTDQVILKNHMQTCMADAIKNGKDGEVIEEVMRVIEKSSP